MCCHITLINKKISKANKVPYFPNFGLLIPNPAIIFKSMGPIFHCCQILGFSVENNIFEIISKLLKKKLHLSFKFGKGMKLGAIS